MHEVKIINMVVGPSQQPCGQDPFPPNPDQKKKMRVCWAASWPNSIELDWTCFSSTHMVRPSLAHPKKRGRVCWAAVGLTRLGWA
jgi:hypothetical protein